MTKRSYYYIPFADNAATIPLGDRAAVDPKWRPEIYKHEPLGALAQEILDGATAGFAIGADRVACDYCATHWYEDIDEVRKHLVHYHPCRGARAKEFWIRRGFVGTNLSTRFPKLCAQAGVEVWRDVQKYETYQSPMMRAPKAVDQKYGTWLPEWAMDIWHGYHVDRHPTAEHRPMGTQRPESKASVAARKLDTPNDWLVFHTLEIANTDTEFRNAVRGLQRNTSSPWDQRDTLADWIASRGHKKPSSFPSHRPAHR